MSDPSLAHFTVEELQRMQKASHKMAREAPRNSPDAPSSAWSQQSKEWMRYCAELERRGVMSEELN